MPERNPFEDALDPLPVVNEEPEEVEEDVEEEEEAETVACDDCGCDFDEDDINSHGLCDSCEENYVECHGCNERLHVDEAHSGGDYYYCDHCYRERYTTCDRCDDEVPRGDTYTVSGDEWCESCYENHSWHCVHCAENFSDSDESTYSEDAGGSICGECRADDFSRCDGCGEWFLDENICDGHCDSCSEEDEDESPQQAANPELSPERIMQYSYKPAAVFFGSRKSVMYGVELEVNDPDHHNDYPSHRETLRLLGRAHVYLKYDSSIGAGYEIVTHPHTLEEHRKLWTPFFLDLPEKVTSYQSGLCGMHVHIERQKLTRLQIGKMLVFINSPANRAFIQKIAQREENTYTKLIEKKLTDRTYIGNHDARYEALNVTNRHTVELRIFRGTVRSDRFWKNLEFTDALVQWTRDVSYRELTAAKFVDYVVAKQREYKYLYHYLIEVGYIDPLEIVRKEILAACA